MSYQKLSGKDWGQVTDKTVTTPPQTQPSQPAPNAPEATLLYKVIKDNKQLGAFAKDINAWSFYRDKNADAIKVNNVDVTEGLRTKFTDPSPTTKEPDGTTQPDTGNPVAEKNDFEEWVKENVTDNNQLLNQILAALQGLMEFLQSIFKGGK